MLALVTNKLLASSSRDGERELIYESGMEPIGGAWIPSNIRGYMFALVSQPFFAKQNDFHTPLAALGIITYSSLSSRVGLVAVH